MVNPLGLAATYPRYVRSPPSRRRPGSGSFRLAAGELGITRSAVSHQIKSLEQHLGLQLFRRDARRAELTQSGQFYYPAIRDAFDQIESQTRTLRPPAVDNELTIQVYVTVALKWLIPRLHDFETPLPGHEGEAVDLLLRLGFRREQCRCGIHPGAQ